MGASEECERGAWEKSGHKRGEKSWSSKKNRRINKTMYQKKEKSRTPSLISNLTKKLYKSRQWGTRIKDIDQRNKTESPEIILYIYGQCILDKDAKEIMGKNEVSSNNKILRRKHRCDLGDLGLGNGFMHMMPKAHSTK